MTVLTVSLLGLALLFPMVIRLNAQSLMASRCLQVSQQELEQLRQNVFSPSGSFTDPEGNMLDVGCWGLPGTSCGNPLTPEGDIDFSLPPAVGYSVEWRDSAGQLYSVRWNITVTAGEGRKIVLATEAVSPPSGLPGRNQLETIMVR